jgi:hypothetical protein
VTITTPPATYLKQKARLVVQSLGMAIQLKSYVRLRIDEDFLRTANNSEVAQGTIMGMVAKQDAILHVNGNQNKKGAGRWSIPKAEGQEPLYLSIPKVYLFIEF